MFSGHPNPTRFDPIQDKMIDTHFDPRPVLTPPMLPPLLGMQNVHGRVTGFIVTNFPVSEFAKPLSRH